MIKINVNIQKILIKEVTYRKNYQHGIAMAKYINKCLPKNLPDTLSTFPEISSTAMLGNFYGIPRRVF